MEVLDVVDEEVVLDSVDVEDEVVLLEDELVAVVAEVEVEVDEDVDEDVVDILVGIAKQKLLVIFL